MENIFFLCLWILSRSIQAWKTTSVMEVEQSKSREDDVDNLQVLSDVTE